MGILGSIFETAAVGAMVNMGQSPEQAPSPIERAVSHVSKLGM